MTATVTRTMTPEQHEAYERYEAAFAAAGGDASTINRGWDGGTLLVEDWRDGVLGHWRIAPDGSVDVEYPSVSV